MLETMSPRATFSAYHPVLLVLDGGDELSELLERAGDDELVVRLSVADALELELDQPLREPTLGLGQRWKERKQIY